MPFEILRKDITEMEVDAIVNSTSPFPSVGGGADFAIHQKAGAELLKERASFGMLQTTRAIITKGYNLPAKHVIHVVGPIYLDFHDEEEKLLYQTYLNALKLADQYHLESIAFPLISSGTFGFPKGIALDIALKVTKAFLEEHDMMIYLLVYDNESYQASKERLKDIKSYLEMKENGNDLNVFYSYKRFENSIQNEETANYSTSFFNESRVKPSRKGQTKRSLIDVVDGLQETFVKSLIRHINEKGLNYIKVYKNANIDRKLFSKITSNDNYQPKKETVIAFAIALELNLDETKDLLNKAGYSLSPSKKFDCIIEYFIENEIYDMYEINVALSYFKQKGLGTIDK